MGGFGHTDAAKRVADSVRMHFTIHGFDCKRKWIAVRLEDGKGGETLYDWKSEAVSHQLDEFLCAYICLTGAPMSVCEAEIILWTHRLAYKNGFRFADSDRMLIRRIAEEHRLRVIQGMRARRKRR
jgi:hypothetical protein